MKRIDRMLSKCYKCGYVPTLEEVRNEEAPISSTSYRIFCNNPWCDNRKAVADCKLFMAVEVWNAEQKKEEV